MATLAEPSALIEFRCPNDGRLLFKVSDMAGVEVEVKCPRCDEIVRAVLTEKAEN